MENPCCHTETLHCIPHYPIIKEDITITKTSIVHDASVRTSMGSPSLNDYLHTGQSLLPDFCAMLLKFQVTQITMKADIEKAFLQVKLSEVDRDATRFLWIKNLRRPILMKELFNATDFAECC